MTIAFGSYAEDDVTFLLTDLTGRQLEIDAGERDCRIAAGHHPARLLAAEHPPPADAMTLFDRALHRSAGRVAHAVGVVAERLLAASADLPVLVSLARAGTPIGVLLRRWAAWRHGASLSHYSISLIRGLGLDQTALGHLSARHGVHTLRFVDGWTGKGAIAAELASALRSRPADTGLAVLTDPGHCATTFGTRDDFLIPSAVLNATVSGLVGGVVLPPADGGPGGFHAATWYPELAALDSSHVFLDVVQQYFPAVVDAVDAEVARPEPPVAAAPWPGRRVAALAADTHGIADLNRVKPGINETVRALLYRRPMRLLVGPEPPDELADVLVLADQRGVPVEEADDLFYACICLIEARGAY
jgi:Tellurite-like stress resistance cysteine protease StiP/PELOTA RNA binding domain